MKQTEVAVDLCVVQELIAHRLRYAFDEIVHKLREAGVPPISIPKWDLVRFGTNVYIIGFVAETLDDNWIATFHPVSYIRMSQLPQFDAYLTGRRFHPKPRKANCIINIFATIQNFLSSVWHCLLLVRRNRP